MITVTLTEAEIRERGASLAQYANKLAELEEEEETVKADHKQTMADIKTRRIAFLLEIKRLSRAIRLGVEERDTQGNLFTRVAKQINNGALDGDGVTVRAEVRQSEWVEYKPGFFAEADEVEEVTRIEQEGKKIREAKKSRKRAQIEDRRESE